MGWVCRQQLRGKLRAVTVLQRAARKFLVSREARECPPLTGRTLACASPWLHRECPLRARTDARSTRADVRSTLTLLNRFFLKGFKKHE